MADGLDAVFRAERGYLFGLLYRLTGSTADADDLVQSTFERALTRPPADTGRPWRPWLVRVAVNLGRDHLRRRRRRAYPGTWLPAPLETDEDPLLFGAADPPDTEGRYELMESVSYAFMLALEALTPTQRAVLLLCDVFEYSGREAADVLRLSEPNVRQHLRRARRAMAAYEQTREPAPAADAQAILRRFLDAVMSGDVPAVEALLAEDVVVHSDAGGEFHAARDAVRGANKVARYFVNIARLDGGYRFALRELNGQPAVVLEVPDAKPGIPPRTVTLSKLDARGRLREIYSVLSTPKLHAVPVLDPDASERIG